MNRVEWYWRYQQAKHLVYQAWLDMVETQTLEAEDRYNRAVIHCDQLQARRP